jgi:hypothetical protein
MDFAASDPKHELQLMKQSGQTESWEQKPWKGNTKDIENLLIKELIAELKANSSKSNVYLFDIHFMQVDSLILNSGGEQGFR